MAKVVHFEIPVDDAEREHLFDLAAAMPNASGDHTRGPAACRAPGTGRYACGGAAVSR